MGYLVGANCNLEKGVVNSLFCTPWAMRTVPIIQYGPMGDTTRYLNDGGVPGTIVYFVPPWAMRTAPIIQYGLMGDNM